MLSYRHAFHVGNFADVIKHIVIIEVLEHLVKKDSPFDYIDTHAGAGLYDLRADQTSKLQEYSQGVGKLLSADEQEDWPELVTYLSIIKQYNPTTELTHYPGSPIIALNFLRDKDRAWLFELHPADCEALAQQVSRDRHVKVIREDGFKNVLSLLPPHSRRGLILVDPPYEVKSDYDQVLETVKKAHTKFATGTYVIWYPVVDRTRIEKLASRLENSGIKKILRLELAIAADESHGIGMTAAGMFVINPPWQLRQTMSTLLPRLVKTLGAGPGASFICNQLVGE